MIAASGSAQAQSTDGVQLQLSLELQEHLPTHHNGQRIGPSFVSGDAITGQTDIETRVDGHAQLRRHDMVLQADQLTHQLQDDVVQATGHVKINRWGNVYEGPELHLQVDGNVGYFLQPRFTLHNKTGQGEASRLDFLGPDQSRAENTIYSTCSRPGSGPWQPDWWISARRIDFDNSTDTGTAYGGVLYFKDVPILAAPYAEFPLSNQRRSGFLPPSVNLSNRSGFEFAQPYYWNLASEYDLTVTPTFMTKRGLDFGSEWRYLQPHASGEWYGAYMPDDKLRQSNRWSLSLQHRQDLLDWSDKVDNLRWRLNINRVGDDDYWRDFPRAGKILTQRLLPNEAALSWERGDWSFSASSYSWQTLQDSTAPIVSPYDRVPSLTARMNPMTLSIGSSGTWDISVQTDLTRFSSDRVSVDYDGKQASVRNGQRAVLLGQLDKSWQAPAWFVKTKLQLQARQYVFDTPLVAAQPVGLLLPTLNLDSGLFFERDTEWWGSNLIQTLEPRLSYANTPYRPQNALPNYDSGPFDFNLSTVYQSNPYAGNDRTADLKALTFGATTRWLRPDNGMELLSLGVAQRYRFHEQRIVLPGEEVVAKGLTDLLLGARLQWTSSLALNSTVQYNPDNHASTRHTLGLRYFPGTYRSFNAAYRYQQQTTTADSRQLDMGWQWPLQGWLGPVPSSVSGRALGPQQWYSVGRINYSLPDSRIVDLLAGFEYDAGCWIGRVVLERLQNSSSTSNQRILFQLEFSDFTRIGASPLQSLRNNVPRYQYLREDINPPSRFERYE